MAYVEVYDFLFTEAQYEAMVAEVSAEWAEMDEWDRSYYDSFEEFLDLSLHARCYPDDQSGGVTQKTERSFFIGKPL